MPLVLTLKHSPDVPLEVEGITPDLLQSKSLADIERVPIFQGNRQLPLGEWFSVAGNPTEEELVWEGDLSRVHWIGAKMASGRMTIHSDCGRHVGSEMSGGEIHVLGSAGDFLGCEMHSGLIRVRGHAGDLVGGAYRGSARGMTGGTIIIGGNAGHEIGHTLRRGLIAVGGSAGELAGFNMLAGSIVLCGQAGIRPGAGMKRGTIAFLGDQPPRLLPSFRRACRCRPEALLLLCRHLRTLDFQIADEVMTSSYDLYSGDLLEGGRGEILLRVAA